MMIIIKTTITIRDVICRSVGRANISAQKEPLGLLRNNGKRPDGVTIIPWKHGRCLTWNVTVHNTCAMSHLIDTFFTAKETAECAAVSKRTKYSTITNTQAFVAVTFELSGAWCGEGLQFISELGNLIILIIILKYLEHHSYVFQHISVALQRGNSICLSGTLLPHSEWYQ